MFTGKNLIELVSVDSTNAYAAQLLAEKTLPEGTAVTASVQQLGKGQAGNIWQSEVGKNLLVSTVFYPAFLAPRHQFFLNQVSSLAVADALDFFLSGEEIRIKWPN